MATYVDHSGPVPLSSIPDDITVHGLTDIHGMEIIVLFTGIESVPAVFWDPLKHLIL